VIVMFLWTNGHRRHMSASLSRGGTVPIKHDNYYCTCY
jgi:hypothetical protein